MPPEAPFAGFESLFTPAVRQALGLYCAKITRTPDEAEDLYADAREKALRFIHTYDDAYPFRNWMYQIAKRLLLDRMRGEAATKRPMIVPLDAVNEFAMLTVASPDPSPYDVVERAGMEARVAALLGGVNPKPAEAVLLRYVEGLGHEEIAARTGTTVSTVKSRIHRGVERLRETMVRAADVADEP